MRWRNTKKLAAEYDHVALLCSRLALFLSAGLHPKSAWAELANEAEGWPISPTVNRVVDGLHSGLRHRDAVAHATRNEADAWREFSAVVGVADLTGAPLSATLWSFSEVLAERSRVEREVRAVSQAPRMTMWMLLGLIPLGLLVASALGAKPVQVLIGSAFGFSVLLLGVGIMSLAVWWMVRLIDQAIPAKDSGAIERELFAIAVSSGALPELALETVHAEMVANELEPAEHTAVQQLASLSRRAGVPVAKLARAEAAWFTQRRRTEAHELAAALSVRILIPVGLLVLPAFVLIAVVPVVISLLGQSLGASGPLW